MPALTPRVIYADGKASDMFYAVGCRVPDPFFFIDTSERKYVFLDAREIGMFDGAERGIEAVYVTPLFDEAKTLEVEGTNKQKLALLLFERYGLLGKRIGVPTHFPLDLADFLRGNGADLSVGHPFFPERSRKAPKEVEAVRTALRKTYKAFDRVREILKDSSVEEDSLRFEGKVLTSEFLKREAERVLAGEGMMSVEGMIISSGPQSAVPHHRGEGPILPYVPIVCDMFPRDEESGYFADMTRTYVKGEPKEEIVKMYEAVRGAQEATFSKIAPGIPARDMHEAACDVFRRSGYEVGEKGFVHSVGHGLGLDVHEAPGLGSGSDTLEPGNVVTVEPGLYYPEFGGIRIEDVVVVIEGGYENLTDYPKGFVIP